MKPTNYAWHRANAIVDREGIAARSKVAFAKAEQGKFGVRLIQSAKEAVEIVKGERSDFRVTPSCGCIFCDVGLEPVKLKRQYVHYIKKEGRIIVCPIKGFKPCETPKT